jgi:GNAT superfamily N-acetyltransferase
MGFVATDDPAFELAIATEADRAARWRLHAAEWGKGYPSADLFVQREHALAHSPFGQGQLQMWLLQGPDGPVASLEVYAAPAWVIQPRPAVAEHEHTEDDLQAEVQLQTLFAFASVLVEPALRGRGYAAALMAHAVAEAGRQGAAATSLYSDVGADLYRRSGHYQHVARESVRAVRDDRWPDAVEALLLGDVADLLAAEHEQSGAWLAASSVPAIVEVPTVERIGWFAVRSQYRAWARGQQPSELVGARHRQGFVLWTADAAEPVLHVLLWRPQSMMDAELLAAAAAAQARELGLQQVIWWDADRDTGLDPYRRSDLQPPDALARTRNTALPMLAWLGDKRQMPLVWMGIERFGWC